jgi:hypothetical protein
MADEQSIESTHESRVHSGSHLGMEQELAGEYALQFRQSAEQ